MPTVLKYNESKPLLAPDTYPARCVGVIELGTQTVTFEGRSNQVKKVQLIFEVPGEVYQSGDNEGKPIKTFASYTMSIGPKSNLGKALVAWRGKEFTDEEKDAFTLDKILDKPCNITINQSGWIEAITKITKGTTLPDAHYKPFYFGLSADDFDQELFNGFHEKLQDKIKLSPEYQELMASTGAGTAQGDTEEEDDLPF